MPESGAACDASLVYFERQDLTSALCAVHCLNNLLQSPLFTAMDLSGAAAELNERERLLRAESGTDSAAYLDWLSAEGGNAYASDSGNFSLSVIQRCLQVVDLSCSRMLPAASASPPPSSVIAVIANLEAHWLVVRRFPVPDQLRPLLPPSSGAEEDDGTVNVWLSLNSLHHCPELVSSTHLLLFLAQLQQDGYSVFLCRWTGGGAAMDEQQQLLQPNSSSSGSSCWYSLRDIILAYRSSQLVTAADSGGHSGSGSGSAAAALEDEDDDDDDAAAVQRAIAASLRESEAEADTELRAAMALSLSSSSAPSARSAPPPPLHPD